MGEAHVQAGRSGMRGWAQGSAEMAPSRSFDKRAGRRNNRKCDCCYSLVFRIMFREFGWCRSVSMSTVWQSLQLRLAPSG